MKEATDEELIQFANRKAQECSFEEFAETLYRLGGRPNVDREMGLKLIKVFEMNCRCHDWYYGCDGMEDE